MLIPHHTHAHAVGIRSESRGRFIYKYDSSVGAMASEFQLDWIQELSLVNDVKFEAPNHEGGPSECPTAATSPSCPKEDGDPPV